MGYPKDRYWKHLYPAWDMDIIKNAPMILLSFAGINITAIFLIYVIANSKLLRQIRPIEEGISALHTDQPIYVREQGLLSDLARNINETGEILRSQKVDLRKKETARANWISGVSHDIRTPLSMVLGYAAQMEEDPGLSPQNRKKNGHYPPAGFENEKSNKRSEPGIKAGISHAAIVCGDSEPACHCPPVRSGFY